MDTEEIERMLSQTDNVNIDQNNANANTSGRRSFKEWLNDILNKPANLIAGAFQKADDMLYKILFGDSNDDGTDGSFISRTLDIVQEKFNAFSRWIHDKLLDPIREKLFGEDGLFDQIKNTQLYQDVREKAVKIKDDLLGMKDENGVRSGGILSDTANELGDIFKEAGYFFGGREYIDSKGVTHPMNPNSVLGEIKSSFSEVGTAVKTQLFGNKGEDGDDENKEGVITRGINSLQTGFQTIADAMFGPKTYTGKDGKEYLNVAYVSLQDFNKSLKEKLPKGLAAGVIGGGAAMLSGGNLGLLGSLFLPGGPIGGAIVGTAVGLLSQSDSFKNFLFGEKDEETGARIGGLISEKTQKFF